MRCFAMNAQRQRSPERTLAIRVPGTLLAVFRWKTARAVRQSASGGEGPSARPALAI